MSASSKVNRNQPCPCGSGKKFKACCAGLGPVATPTATVDINMLQQQAQQAVARSNFVEAELCFRQLTALKPSDAYFKASLGQALCWLSRRREGKEYLVQAARLLERQASKSRDPRFVVELSGQLMHWGEPVTAEKLARLAVALAPHSPVALNNLVLCLTRLNRNKEALPIAQKVCQLLPEHPGCNILLAILESKLVGVEPALARLETVIDRNEEREQTARAWLEKAVILDKAKLYDEAYAAMVKAGELHAALSPYSPEQREQIFDTLEQNREGFGRDLLQRWPKESLVDDGLPAPAFLVGFLRSGTTLTEQVLGSHPKLIATDESSIVHELTQELQRMAAVGEHNSRALNTLTLAQVKVLRQFYWRRMREEYGDAVMSRQLIDKNALNTIELGVISVVFPEAKILFALRDPRDVCLSCFQQAFSPSPATANLTSLPGIAKQYAAVMGYWLAIREQIQPTYLELRYEDTVMDFEITFRRVFDFLGVEWHPAVNKFHERAQGRYISTPSFAAVSQPVYQSAVQRWVNYAKHFETVHPLLKPFVDAFGYAQSTDNK